MTVALYIDHNVPLQITLGLRQRDVDTVTADEDGAARFRDARLLSRATQLSRSVFSMDRDFLKIAKEWTVRGKTFTGVIFAHQRGITFRTAIDDLELIAKVFDLEDMRNRVIFLPL